MSFDWFFYLFDLAGTLVFAVSGALAGIRKRLDWYGIAILAVVTALGGGMLRDVLIGRTPPGVFTDGAYLAIALAGAVLAIAGHRVVERFQHPMRIMDAIGLGIFTVIGVKVTLAAGGSWFAAIMLGVMTGTGGGMIRDVLVQEVPMVLQREVYAVASLAGAAACLAWLELAPRFGLGGLEGLGAVLAAALTAGIRIAAVLQDWHLPKVAERQAGGVRKPDGN